MDSFAKLRLNNAIQYLSERGLSTAQLRAFLADPNSLDKLSEGIARNRDQRLRSSFRNLSTEPYEVTSNIDFSYNCIAWSVCDMSAFWWPLSSYWPPGILCEESIAAFRELYRTMGFSECQDGAWEPDYLKIAIYAKNGIPTHAARQLDENSWTSKLGRWEDIRHTLLGLSGEEYGEVIAYFRRKNNSPFIGKNIKHQSITSWFMRLIPFLSRR